jgi:alpha-ketoglutarate-dependent taurine dioxygenase
MIRYEQTFLNDDGLPRTWQVTHGGDAPIDGACAWLREERPLLEQEVRKYGALLIRGIQSADSAESFARLMEVIAPELMDYVGGTSPRQVVHGRIMTATELPPAYSIPLHQEMSYTDDSPDRIVFYCRSPAPEGGFTTVADMRAVTARIDPSVRKRFADKKGVQLRRTLPSADALHKKPGVAKSWAEVFGTSDREEVARIVQRKGWKIHWLDDQSVQLWQEVRPPTRAHPITGDEVWHNQVHIYAPVGSLAWARKDGRREQVEQIERALLEHPEMVDRVLHGTGELVADQDALHIFEVMDRSAIPVHWKPCDVLVLDNILAAHGRTSFRGPRTVLTALVRDDRSRVRLAA